MRSTAIILLLLFLGKILQQAIALPIPGSILALLILFGLLANDIMPLQWVLPAGNLLLQYLILFFIPVGVGLLKYTDLLAEYWLAVSLASLVSTLLVILVTGRMFQSLSK